MTTAGKVPHTVWAIPWAQLDVGDIICVTLFVDKICHHHRFTPVNNMVEPFKSNRQCKEKSCHCAFEFWLFGRDVKNGVQDKGTVS